MQKNHRQSQNQNGRESGWALRTTTLSGVLGAALFFAAIHSPSQALGAVPSGTTTLAWDASSSPGVAGYRVYYGPASGNYTSSVVAGNSTTTTISSLAVGSTYFFAVKAFNASGVESAFSNEISFVPGTPTIQIQIGANRQAVLTVKGQVGRTYDIQAAPDLKTWSVIGNTTIGSGGSGVFTDVNAPTQSKRFYRARDTQP